jgi:hypothetical protein
MAGRHQSEHPVAITRCAQKTGDTEFVESMLVLIFEILPTGARERNPGGRREGIRKRH